MGKVMNFDITFTRDQTCFTPRTYQLGATGCTTKIIIIIKRITAREILK